jgi:hypothetical protein
MTRRLLPYEHQLIDALGITKEEYLEFVKAQFDYTRLPAEKQEEPVAWEVVAIVLTVLGTIFQVAAALTAPKPEKPKAQRLSRDQAVSPRFGFNNVQELAKYGDPISLVYCNTDQNALGGVRVNTSLVWAAVKSYGSTQFMQSLSVVGASYIDPSGIDFTRTAFGQAPLSQFQQDSVWIYYRRNGNPLFPNLRVGKGTVTSPKDPTALGGIADTTPVYRVQLDKASFSEGFSQVFSPTSQTRCGVFSAIPINVDVQDRDENGDLKSVPLNIVIPDIEAKSAFSSYWPLGKIGYPDGSRVVCPVGATFKLRINNLTTDRTNPTRRNASELRRIFSSTVDLASTYKLGSAKFRCTDIDGDVDYDKNGGMQATFECIEAGYCPTEDYKTTNYRQNENEAKAEIASLETQRAALVQRQALLTISQNPKAQKLTDKLEEIKKLEDFIDDANDKVWTYSEIDTILENRESFGGTVVHFATKLDEARNERKKITKWISDLLSFNKPERVANYGENWKKQLDDKQEELTGWNIAVRKRQATLTVAFRNEGFRDSVYETTRDGKKGNLREDKRALRALRKKIQGEIYNLMQDGARIDTESYKTEWNSLQSQINNIDLSIRKYEAELRDPEKLNDYFGSKCLVKIEEARYETITKCAIVDIALKSRIFMKVQGRAPKYGERKAPNFKTSDNGTKIRSCYFWVLYRKTATAGATENTWTRSKRIFVIRRGTENESFNSIRFLAASGSNAFNWQFRLEPIADINAEMSYHYNGNCNFAYIENAGASVTVNQDDGCKFQIIGRLRSRDSVRRLPPINDSPSEIDEWTLFSCRSDTQLALSFDSGPEIEIKAVTEQRIESFSAYPTLYSDLGMLGFNTYSGAGVQDLRALSLYINKGKKVRTINEDGTISPNKIGKLDQAEGTASSYAPEIFLDTLLDPLNGIGNYTKLDAVCLKSLALCKKFCRTYSLFFDGVIAEPTSWRQFWSEVAPFSLLEFGRIGGKDTLIPALPVSDTGAINRDVPISALFTAGNILDDSYKEEYLDYGTNVTDLIASVIYRDTELDGYFPKNRSVEVRLKDTTEASALRQTFDLSQYVTTRDQAIMYGKLLCRQRRHIRKSIEFKTFPTDSVLAPGSYIYVDVGQQQWNNIYSGRVEAGGVLNMPVGAQITNGSYSILLYSLNGKQEASVDNCNPVLSDRIITKSITVSSNSSTALKDFEGYLFVLGTPTSSKRVFRVIEVAMDEEGEVTVRGVEHPCDSSGKSLIADMEGFQID